MFNFNQLYDLLDGGTYSKSPPPTKYKFAEYLSTSNVQHLGNTDCVLTPLTIDDMKQASEEDVVKAMLSKGNTSVLGKPMNDEEFNSFCGL